MNHSVVMRASDLQRRLGVRYHISISSLGACVGVAGVQRGVVGGSLKNARGRGVWGLWVSAANCVWSTFVLWVIFWLSGIDFRVISPPAGNRCFTLTLLELSVSFGICIKPSWSPDLRVFAKKKSNPKNSVFYPSCQSNGQQVCSHVSKPCKSLRRYFVFADWAYVNVKTSAPQSNKSSWVILLKSFDFFLF